MFDILPTINRWLATGQPVALATVADTWGSAPRPAGASMGITADMQMVGSVSGGCVESAVVSTALDLFETGTPLLLKFGIADDTAWGVGLACGGSISILLEPLHRAWWQVVREHLEDNRALATATMLAGEQIGGRVAVAASESAPSPQPVFASEGLSSEQQRLLAEAAATALDTKQTHRRTRNDLDLLVQVHLPRPRLFLIGGAHIAIPLATMGQQLGFQVVVIDPRQAFATAERFPTVAAISHDYPDVALSRFGLDANSYIAVLTHDPKIDDPALLTALPSPAPYVGVLSSRRTHARRVERLKAAGLEPALLERIYTPIGLDIAARTPEEIALCILAEIVALRNGGAMRNRQPVPPT